MRTGLPSDNLAAKDTATLAGAKRVCPVQAPRILSLSPDRGQGATLAVFGMIEAGLSSAVAWPARHRRPAVAALPAVAGAALAGVSGEFPVPHWAGQAGDLGTTAGRVGPAR
jgi:hypothetical protein